MVKEVVRELRKNQTETEKILWQNIRNRQIANSKFIRQYPLKVNIDGQKRYFIADFYCPENKLAIELDGAIHKKQKEYDVFRDRIMNEKNIKVLRFSNNQVVYNLVEVIKTIEANIHISPLSARKG